MILLWCLCGTLAAFCIGRYNQSNKLFWALFTSFVLGIAGVSVYNKYTENQSEVQSTTQVYPTQESSVNGSNVAPYTEPAMCASMPAPAGKVSTPEYETASLVRTLCDITPQFPPPRKT